jgi:hypothetical protein
MTIYELQCEIITVLQDSIDSNVETIHMKHDIFCCKDMTELVNTIVKYGWSIYDAIEILGDILISQD